MESLFIKAQVKFKSLKKNEKIATVTILSLFVGLFFFVSGISIGEALYQITH
jgi:uncharacterized membrane protein